MKDGRFCNLTPNTQCGAEDIRAPAEVALRLSPLRAQAQCALVPAVTTEHTESERKERDGDNTRQLGSPGQRRGPCVSLEADRHVTAFATVSSTCATTSFPHRRWGLSEI